MSQRGEDLARFRDQMTPDGPPVPPRLFWLAMGVGFGVALEEAYRLGGAWWTQALFVLAMGALFGLILNLAVWFAWSILEPIWSGFTDWRARRREAESDGDPTSLAD